MNVAEGLDRASDRRGANHLNPMVSFTSEKSKGIALTQRGQLPIIGTAASTIGAER